MVIIMVILDLVLVLGPPTYPPKKEILLATGEVGDIRNCIMIAQRPPWFYLAVGIIQVALISSICLLLLLDILKVVWVLGSPTLTQKKLIVGLVVTILCYQVVDNIHP